MGLQFGALKFGKFVCPSVCLRASVVVGVVAMGWLIVSGIAARLGPQALECGRGGLELTC
jgi:hypothetical protein